jgi:hypothetical protein
MHFPDKQLSLFFSIPIENPEIGNTSDKYNMIWRIKYDKSGSMADRVGSQPLRF